MQPLLFQMGVWHLFVTRIYSADIYSSFLLQTCWTRCSCSAQNILVGWSTRLRDTQHLSAQVHPWKCPSLPFPESAPWMLLWGLEVTPALFSLAEQVQRAKVVPKPRGPCVPPQLLPREVVPCGSFPFSNVGAMPACFQEDLGASWNTHVKIKFRLTFSKLTWKYLQGWSVNFFKSRLLAVLLGIMIVEPEP